jgi:putative pyruvate formate lyase activating enzyme
LRNDPDFFLSEQDFKPAYRKLPDGELPRRAAEAAAGLADCRFCPRACGTNRHQGLEGVCRD